MDFDFSSQVVPRMVPTITQVVFVISPKGLSEPQLPTLWLVCGALGTIKGTHLSLRENLK
jgi:hypothetical protein